ncbi:MAG: hypothetical protein U0793_19115 [Gemmataceae bacterium]
MLRRLSPLLFLLALGCSGGSADKPSVSEEPIAKGPGDELILPGAGKASDAIPPKTTPGGPQTVQFLNSQGTGRHFCIIADHSLSIGDPSLALIKKEIVKTLSSMNERSSFYVILFAKEPLPMPGAGWLSATKDNIDKTAGWMAPIGRLWGTIPAPAFRKALALEPRPDVIFFMTDGQLQPKKATSLIADLNRKEPKVPINTILFTKSAAIVPPENRARADLEIIARDSGGTFHQFIDPDGAPKKKKKKA